MLLEPECRQRCEMKKLGCVSCALADNPCAFSAAKRVQHDGFSSNIYNLKLEWATRFWLRRQPNRSQTPQRAASFGESPTGGLEKRKGLWQPMAAMHGCE